MQRNTYSVLVILSIHCVCFAARTEQFVRIRGQKLLDHVVSDSVAVSAIDCSTKCLIQSSVCLSVNFNPSTEECQLCDDSPLVLGSNVEMNASWNLYHISVSDPCGDSWFNYGASCYWLSPFRKRWVDSDTTCRTLGAGLVEINDSSENAFVSIVALMVGRVWLGLNDLDVEGDFVWSSGQSVSYNNFGVNEGGSNENEDCVILLASASTWHDVMCGSLEYIFCETPLP